MPAHHALAAPLDGDASPPASPLDALIVALATGLFIFPALLALAEGSWRSEAGSLSPIVLALGCWVLWRTFRDTTDAGEPGLGVIWLPAVVVAASLAVFAAAIGMPSLHALAAWLGGCAAFYACFGWPALRRCAFPLVFLGLLIPLPFALSIHANAVLRAWVAEQSVGLAWFVGMDAALEEGNVIVGPYVLAVEDACAGASSTLTLVAIGLLYSFWAGGGWSKTILLAAISVPVALLANVGRVVALMALVGSFGSGIVDTWLHPLSGIISFLFALAMMFLLSAAIDAYPWLGRRR